ncbi:hypothetical protein TNIN_440821 [Trichonephila inaurata madagascariensis]|uniref:Uncharacterized protein n=1 Tax=Trichonephila inaurata madagascariensis TaxID=2747483 RepID=A0A8X6XXZ7_9ARAC|nr:hypothetical protein TNIN_440821 [Trichonephila inaurata madagascariensis]
MWGLWRQKDWIVIELGRYRNQWQHRQKRSCRIEATGLGEKKSMKDMSCSDSPVPACNEEQNQPTEDKSCPGSPVPVHHKELRQRRKDQSCLAGPAPVHIEK